MKITIIGAGNMGGALVRGLMKRGRYDITLTAHTQKTLDRFRAEFPALHTTLDNKAAAQNADLIILAVKPWIIPNVLSEISSVLNIDNQIVVSVAANIYTEKLRGYLDSKSAKVFYAMPNIAAEYGESMTFISQTEGVPQTDIDLVADLFKEVGEVKVCEERLMGAGMMMAGCGIAYVMRFIRAMQEGGVEMGFYPEEAKNIALQTMQGAVAVLKETGLHPEVAIDRVTTPGGVTIKGLNELERTGFNTSVISCLKAGMK